MKQEILDKIENIEYIVMNMQTGVGKFKGFDKILKDVKVIKTLVENLNMHFVTVSSCPMCGNTNIAIKHDKTRAKCLHCAHDWAI
jgi:ribosomal protein S27E